MRPKLERVEYPAQRELSMNVPTAETPAPNFWSLDHDNRSWVTQGKNFSMYKNERTYYEPQKPASATDFYNTDQSAKMSMSHKVQRSPYRYVSMRSSSAGREADRVYLGTFIGTPERVGPGLYGAGTAPGAVMPRSEPGSSSFASGMVRGTGLIPKNVAEPGYSTLYTDKFLWNKHENRQRKGYTFQQTQRWERPAGPGSNRPAERSTPGPGSYGRLHSWPSSGFKGSARGFNHNSAVG